MRFYFIADRNIHLQLMVVDVAEPKLAQYLVWLTSDCPEERRWTFMVGECWSLSLIMLAGGLGLHLVLRKIRAEVDTVL